VQKINKSRAQRFFFSSDLPAKSADICKSQNGGSLSSQNDEHIGQRRQLCRESTKAGTRGSSAAVIRLQNQLI
jgi:hypothetical protein